MNNLLLVQLVQFLGDLYRDVNLHGHLLCSVGSKDLTNLVICLLFRMHIAIYATVLVVF